MSLSQLEKHIKTINRLSTEIRMLDKMIERCIMKQIVPTTYMHNIEAPKWEKTEIRCKCGAELWHDKTAKNPWHGEWFFGDADHVHKAITGIPHA